jgi:hypothetical protein
MSGLLYMPVFAMSSLLDSVYLTKVTSETQNQPRQAGEKAKSPSYAGFVALRALVRRTVGFGGGFGVGGVIKNTDAIWSIVIGGSSGSRRWSSGLLGVVNLPMAGV